jgi:hypothetical protein
LLSTVPEAVDFVYAAHPSGSLPERNIDWHVIRRSELPPGQFSACLTSYGVEVAVHRILYDMASQAPEPIGFVSLQFDDADAVPCDPKCTDIPCRILVSGKEKLDDSDTLLHCTGSKTLCDSWEESSTQACNLIEKYVNEASLQMSGWKRFLLTFLRSPAPEEAEKAK